MKINREYVFDVLTLFGKLIDRWSRGSSISPYLALTIRPLLDPDIIWLIKDTTDIISHNILVKPVKAIYLQENYNLCIRDYIIDIESKIEYFYGVYLPNEDYYKIGGWTDRKFYQYIRRKFPKAFEEHEKRIQIGRKIARKKRVKIENMITPDGGLYQQIKVNIKNYSIKKIVDTITTIEDIFIEIYSEIEGIPKEKFKTPWKEYRKGWNKLLKLHHYLEEIIKHIPPKTSIETLYITNSSYSPYKRIGIQLKTIPTITTIHLEFANTTKDNTLYIKITAPKSLNTILKKLKDHNPTTHNKQHITITKEGIPEHQIITTTKEILSQLNKP